MNNDIHLVKYDDSTLTYCLLPTIALVPGFEVKRITVKQLELGFFFDCKDCYRRYYGGKDKELLTVA